MSNMLLSNLVSQVVSSVRFMGAKGISEALVYQSLGVSEANWGKIRASLPAVIRSRDGKLVFKAA